MARQGSGISSIALSAIAVLLSFSAVNATSYLVGDDRQWSVGPNFTEWAADKTFKLNDVLVFKYRPGDHTVVVVGEKDYNSCSDANAIAKYTSGDDQISLVESEYYFFCSTPTHCALGQKFHITVATGGATTADLPSTAPPPVATSGVYGISAVNAVISSAGIVFLSGLFVGLS